ncbi:Tannase/feruloyl esterase [Fusarium flagelliforme]|uniref:Tannase/feruloyl esterase n=1 Tax=Fusarium flagelliforme TaxID=2675880 RepID=UPI001E8DDF4C|nr:Tannase/feruloyl esterase [Fusarium flagelliforme]KAH7174049.1 Tannase/feruloyl esterase [Fusarium flagelliforme]
MATSLIQACNATTFSPSIYGADILGIQAEVITNYSVAAPEVYRYVAPTVEEQTATFCNVTVTYTHPGQNDTIEVETWLPIDTWNGRLQAVGGGGWVAGRFFLSYAAMRGALADGFATISTNAGLGGALDAGPWALSSPGNVNLYNLQNFASVSLEDQAVIGKSLIKDFYGRGPEFSYWTGCSQGGRQGLMLAQRYPTAYDGIIAGAPAIHWTELFSYVQWPQQVMNELASYPPACEFDAITSAAFKACDGLDGVVDGVISKVDECLETFDPFTVVGEAIKCPQLNGTQVQISKSAAAAVNATWQGMPIFSGRQTYHGIAPGAQLTGTSSTSFGQPGLLSTDCTSGRCVADSSLLGVQWLQLFLAKNPELDLATLSRSLFQDLVHAGQQQYSSIVDTTDADLTRFRDAGGKMISFHGLADNIIPPKSTENYYNAVADLSPDIRSFYRYFEAPGLGHCFGGASRQPTQLFNQLRHWVENGTAPEVSAIKVNAEDGTEHSRILCAYPKQAEFDRACGDPAAARCWSCTV